MSRIKDINFTITGKRTWTAIQEGWPVIVNEGGARSGKTYSAIQCLIIIAYNFPKTRISIVSHSLPHIKRGALRDFEIIMKEEFEIWDDNLWYATDFIYKFKNGSYIELFGLEDETKARGPGRDILFINEANLVKHSLYKQLSLRTEKQVLIDLNPADFDCWCYGVADWSGGMIEGKYHPGNKKIHSTYKDNIQNLSERQVAEIEAYQLADPYMWEVFGLGLRGKSTETIYTHWKLCEALPLRGEIFCGQDFGYVVPAALVRCEYYEGAIYVEELMYETKLTNPEIAGRYEQLNVSKTIEIFCDAAEPKTIEEIARYGYNVKAADKDVWAGIQKVKSMPLYITENSVNLLKEIKNYKWKLDKDGNVKPEEEPVKMNDHLLDALRYAVFTKLSGPQFTWVAF